MVIYKLVAGDQQTPLIETYLPLPTLYHSPDLEEALKFLTGREPIFLGDLNEYIGRLRIPGTNRLLNSWRPFG